MAKNPNGSGSIGQYKNGWRAQYSAGFDPKTGKLIRKSIYGKTQKKVRDKLFDVTKDIVDNVYVNPSKTTVGEWLDSFLNNYNGDVRSGTMASYETTIRVHLKPTLGRYKLTSLTTEMIQKTYKAIENGATSRKGKLSPKTIKNCHGVLHKALKKAQRLGYIRVNPADAATLSKTEKPIIRPLTNDEVAKLLAEISGHKYEDLFFFTIFTGMRQSEVLGLTWECVDLERGIITIKRQLLPPKGKIKDYHFAPLKNSTIRT